MAGRLSWLKSQQWVDRAVAAALASPLHRLVSRRLVLLLVPGRRTGRIYRVPAGYVQHGEQLFIGTGPTQWRRNLEATPDITVVLRCRSCPARAEVITDEPRFSKLYRHILTAGLVHARYAGIRADPDGSPNPDDVRRALAAGTALIRLTLG